MTVMNTKASFISAQGSFPKSLKRVAKCIFSRFAMLRFKLLPSHVAVDLIRSHHGSPTTVGGLRTGQIAMAWESEPPFACRKSVVRSSNRPDHRSLHAQFPSDQSTNLIHSGIHIT